MFFCLFLVLCQCGMMCQELSFLLWLSSLFFFFSPPRFSSFWWQNFCCLLHLVKNIHWDIDRLSFFFLFPPPKLSGIRFSQTRLCFLILFSVTTTNIYSMSLPTDIFSPQCLVSLKFTAGSKSSLFSSVVLWLRIDYLCTAALWHFCLFIRCRFWKKKKGM